LRRRVAFGGAKVEFGQLRVKSYDEYIQPIDGVRMQPAIGNGLERSEPRALGEST